jgi:hypothetical protein
MLAVVVEFRIKPAHIEACDAAVLAKRPSPHLLLMIGATAPWVDGKVVRRLQRARP